VDVDAHRSDPPKMSNSAYVRKRTIANQCPCSPGSQAIAPHAGGKGATSSGVNNQAQLARRRTREYPIGKCGHLRRIGVVGTRIVAIDSSVFRATVLIDADGEALALECVGTTQRDGAQIRTSSVILR